jgi:hypothetical protein
MSPALSIIGLAPMTQKLQLTQSLGGRVSPCHGEWWGGLLFFQRAGVHSMWG